MQELFFSLQTVRGIRPHFCPVMQIHQLDGRRMKLTDLITAAQLKERQRCQQTDAGKNSPQPAGMDLNIQNDQSMEPSAFRLVRTRIIVFHIMKKMQ